MAYVAPSTGQCGTFKPAGQLPEILTPLFAPDDHRLWISKHTKECSQKYYRIPKRNTVQPGAFNDKRDQGDG
jgi:hypothetical protein